MQHGSSSIRVTKNEAACYGNAWKGTQGPKRGTWDATVREVSGSGSFGNLVKS